MVEGAVQALHSTPLHTSLEMFYPAKAGSTLYTLDSQQGKSEQNMVRFVLPKDWLGAVRTVSAQTI